MANFGQFVCVRLTPPYVRITPSIFGVKNEEKLPVVHHDNRMLSWSVVAKVGGSPETRGTGIREATAE